MKNTLQATGEETFEPTVEEISEQANVMKLFHEASPVELHAEAEWQHNTADVGIMDSNCEEKKVCFSRIRICIPVVPLYCFVISLNFAIPCRTNIVCVAETILNSKDEMHNHKKCAH